MTTWVTDTLGTSYSPPVKCNLILLNFQRDNCWPFFRAHVAPASSVRTAAFSSTVLSRKANLLSERYNYPACRCRQASLIQILKFYERPCIVPHEVMRLNVVARAICVEEFRACPELHENAVFQQPVRGCHGFNMFCVDFIQWVVLCFFKVTSSTNPRNVTACAA